MINLLKFLSQKEYVFIQLSVHGVLINLLDFLTLNESSEYFDNKLNIFKIYSSFLKHKSGLDWISVNNITEKIIDSARNSDVPETFEASCQFIALAVEKSLRNNEPLCKKLTKKLINSIFNNSASIARDDAKTKKTIKLEKIFIKLKFINGVMKKLLEECCKIRSFQIFTYFEEKFTLHKRLNELRSSSTNENIILEIDSIIFLLIFFNIGNILINPFMGAIEREEKIRRELCELTDIALKRIRQDQVLHNLKLCYNSLASFQCIKHLIVESHYDNDTDILQFETQMVAFQIMPLSFSIHVPLNLRMERLTTTDDVREMLFYKVIKGFSETTMRFLLKLRGNSKNTSLDEGIVILENILETKHFYSKHMVNLLVEWLTFIFGDVISAKQTIPEKCKFLTEELFDKLLDVLIEFVQEFNITWLDSIKFLSIIDLTYNFLKFEFNSTKVSKEY